MAMLGRLVDLKEEAQRNKKLAESSLMINVMTRLLLSKGIITDAEIANETARIQSSDDYLNDIAAWVDIADEEVHLLDKAIMAYQEERCKDGGVKTVE